MKILSIIPARGGSKGLVRKNILPLLDKPLIAWTIKASLKSKYITDTVVSSDDDEILSTAHTYGANCIKRPKEFATDEATSQSVVAHALEYLKEKNLFYDYVILLQPTSPLRTTCDINESLEVLWANNATALISVQEYNNKILKAFIEEETGFIKGIANNHYPFERRQNLPKTYISNGAIYIIKVQDFLRKKSFLTDKTVKYIMDEKKSIDIDTREDIEACEKYLRSSCHE